MRRAPDGEGHRHARLEQVLLLELRSLLRDDVSDPDLADVWVTAVVLSVDYRHARVHFASTGSAAAAAAEPSPIGRALLRATPYLRSQLAASIELKRVPELRFVFDGVAASSGGQSGPGGSSRPS